MERFLNVFRRGALLAGCLLSMQTDAGVVIGATRVIFPAEQREVTVKMTNVGSHPSLVQSWVDDGHPEVPLEHLRVPFRLTPPLFRLDPGKAQSLRLFHTGEVMPGDRESLYWLNVLEVPPKGAGNFLQFALRSRIKLLYRPQGLPGKATDAHRAVTWQVVRDGHAWAMQADNSGPFFVNLARLEIIQGEQVISLKPAHVAPFASVRFALEAGDRPAAIELRYAVIDDYGAVRDAPAVSVAQWEQ
ncbi:molecular chaperone [Pseudomonas sp. xss_2]|uniref:fimbrial biogenesis chaperone n=1 Tax=Pseudomonas sp. xss_2 TaxID=3367215 RepID=UPI00370AEA04